MIDRYELFGAASGITIALFVFSLIQQRTIRLQSGADTGRMLGLVVAAEWAVLAIFVLAELLPGAAQSWLKSLAISFGASIAILYALCIIRLRSLGLMQSPNPAKLPQNRPKRRHRIRAHD